MWGVLFIYAWLADIKTLMANEIEAILAGFEDEEDDDSVIPELVAALWLVTRVAAYMAWLAQVGFMRKQAMNQGTDLEFVPSMGGIPEHLIEEVVRLEVREGLGKAPRAELADRLTYRLDTIVNEVARDAARVATGADKDAVLGSKAYANKYGEPDARLIASIETGHGEVGRYVAEHEEMRKAFKRLIRDYQDEFTTQTPREEKAEKADSVADFRRKLADRFAQLDAEKRENAVQAFDKRAADLLEAYDAKRDEKAVRKRVAEEKKRRTRQGQRPRSDADLMREMREQMAREDFEQVMALRMDELAYAASRAGREVDFERFPIGWARIPTGSYTCAFCLVLASRGAVYRSNTVVTRGNTRKAKKKGVTVAGHSINAYHMGCDCIGVPVYKDNFRMDKSTAGDMSGAGIDGEASVFGAFQLWEAFAREGVDLTIQNFKKWLESAAGQELARQVLPDITTSAKDYRRVQRKHVK